MSHKRKVLQGSASNMVRVLLSMLVSLVLPPFLVHRMTPAEYSAWVLILQMSAYVNLLDFGLQTAIGKFVAEYDASGDRDASRRLLSTSFTILAGTAVIGCIVIFLLTWSVPKLFHQMPAALIPEVRLALLAIGLSTALTLPFGTFLSSFVGLQQYLFPTIVATASRVGSAAGLIVLLLMHCNLVELALVMAAFNVATAASQFLGWQRFVSERVGFSFLLFDRPSAVKLAKYGSVLSIWTVAMLLISGLDVVIVGHFDYRNTGFYAVASSITNFMLLVVSSVFGPVLPAVSSIQAGSTPSHIGELVIRVTRYCTLLLCLLGLPILFGAYPLLSLWVGHQYAVRSALYLEILVIGNVVRQLTYPYVLVVVATGRQHLTTISAIAEATVNIVVSVLLVTRIGAVGVAIGTLVGAFVGLGIHLAVSMHFTQPTIQIRRLLFAWQGLFRPLLCVAPSLLLYPFWRRSSMLPANPAWLAIWVILTLAIALRVVLTAAERRQLMGTLSRLLYSRRLEQT
jgi:O-antigen/teichoic acid export membrane protein